MVSLNKTFQPKAHRERSQPKARAHLGLLEKHKDYVLRARDFHSKQDRLKALQVKAKFRNPDEFYFGMINSSTKNGVHVKQRENSKAIPTDVVKLLKSQDLAYVSMVKTLNKKRLDRMQEEVVELSNRISRDGGESKKLHLRFAEDKEEQMDILSSLPNQIDYHQEDEPAKSSEDSPALKEYLVRQERVRQLELAEKQLQLQRSLMSKGRRRKMGEDEYGLPKYKWSCERKK